MRNVQNSCAGRRAPGLDHAAARAAGVPSSRAHSRGLTLVELVIVITIIGVLTAAISIGVLQAQKRANVGAAKTACSTIRQATMQWKAVNPSSDCATVEQLKTEKDLDTGFSLKDPWGNLVQALVRRRRDHLHERGARPQRGHGRRHPRASDRHARRQVTVDGPGDQTTPRSEPRTDADRDHRGALDHRARHDRRGRGDDAAAVGAGFARRATLITSAVKVGYTRATATSRDLRLVMDFDQAKIWLEETERADARPVEGDDQQRRRRGGDQRRA